MENVSSNDLNVTIIPSGNTSETNQSSLDWLTSEPTNPSGDSVANGGCPDVAADELPPTGIHRCIKPADYW